MALRALAPLLIAAFVAGCLAPADPPAAVTEPPPPSSSDDISAWITRAESAEARERELARLLEEAEGRAFIIQKPDKLRLHPLAGVALDAQEPSVFLDASTVQVGQLACTGSMKPAMDCGDLLLTQPPDASRLAPGVVVGYRVDSGPSECPGGLIVHRIVRVETNAAWRTDDDPHGLAFVLKGDANPREDPCRVNLAAIQYIVVGVLHDARLTT